MKALLNENGFIISYALVGDLVDGVDLPDPEDVEHFQENFAAYKVRDGTAAFDSEHNDALLLEAKKDEYRLRREKECFSIINRGQLWYDKLSKKKKEELEQWYQAWLDATNTGVMPKKLAWL